MGRKAELRTLVRKEKALWKARTEGILDARNKNIEKLPIGVLVKQYLGEMIKKIDPLKLTATIALTPIVKMAIDKAPDVLSLYQKLIMVGSPIVGWLFTQTIDPEQFRLDETFTWVVSFGIAYLVVENFGEILSSGLDIGGFVAKLFLI